MGYGQMLHSIPHQSVKLRSIALRRKRVSAKHGTLLRPARRKGRSIPRPFHFFPRPSTSFHVHSTYIPFTSVYFREHSIYFRLHYVSFHFILCPFRVSSWRYALLRNPPFPLHYIPRHCRITAQSHFAVGAVGRFGSVALPKPSLFPKLVAFSGYSGLFGALC